MSKICFSVTLILTSFLSFAGETPDPCQLFEYCRGGSSSSFKSAKSSSTPSTSSSAGLNPSNLSKIRGLGVEAIYQPNNPVNFGLASGNGRIGALLSPATENSFFGSRTIEINDVQKIRQRDKKQYKNNKYNFATGLNVVGKKKYGLDLGVSARWNEDIKMINPGYGVTLNLGPFHFGAFNYKDDIKIYLADYIDPYTSNPYSEIYPNSTYQETFWVETYTAGLKFRNFTFDYGVINVNYHFYHQNTRVYLYCSTYTWRNWLFLGALRKEFSPNFQYIKGNMVEQRKKREIYYGFQYLVNRHLALGMNYNYFLLHELSGSATVLF